ncbi:dihydropteroate synthase [Rhodovulum marinum]|uniref:Dihydropteroate synthase n=1 Tax=Rhodovulum marinum TaxID=320662 RepID=A0A4R2Q3R0_9RHOB|nr:dihydropteroate synthase [Rhodovulum marinum]TCP43210.1 dihydropteroate synthase [Rhodovulum marinum]
MQRYFRPIVQTDAARPADALPLAGGWAWFAAAEELFRDAPPRLLPAGALPEEARAALAGPRPALAGLTMDRPRIMGILNVTPDSFSDGGRFDAPAAALAHGRALAEAADILDIGGESTRPGAREVPVDEEIARTAPVIAALRKAGVTVPISIDTRKAAVAGAALAAGADMVNDVAAFTHDPALAEVAARAEAPVCLMHAQGDPETMQNDPHYDNVLLDVYDFLAQRIAAAEAAGIPRARIVADPGIGFGKTVAHNLALLRGLSLFHGLGCPVLLGASRKRFIGALGHEPQADRRGPGSVAVALAGIAQGVQILRVHDVAETRQAMRLDGALKGYGVAE